MTIQRKEADHLAPFSIKELRDAIPKHCFDRSASRSFMYVGIDFAVIAAMVSVSYLFNSNNVSELIANKVASGNAAYVLSWIISIVFWNAMWFAQGAVMTGLWVIAHECGHQSFSPSKTLNNTVGLILHSALLVPYHSWRITHGIHHKSTSHMDRDQVYVPKLKSEVEQPNPGIHEVISESPLVNLFQITLLLTVGWPFYIATNAWGQKYGRRTNHFEPTAPMFKKSHKAQVIISDIGLLVVLAAITFFAMNTSFSTMMKFYGVPYLWVNHWLVLITYLQHVGPDVPHYRGEEWNFIRGALCTIDRDYGFLNKVFHHIGDTHVAHHLFSQMPHYHAEEATECLKKVLGNYYKADHSPIYKSLWQSWTSCHYVDDEGPVVYYKKMSTKSD